MTRATMPGRQWPAKRHFVPGLWGRCGRAIPDNQATEMDSVISYPIEDLRQGRDAQNRVPHFSMYAGKPEAEPDTRWSLLKFAGWCVMAAVFFGLILGLHEGMQ